MQALKGIKSSDQNRNLEIIRAAFLHGYRIKLSHAQLFGRCHNCLEKSEETSWQQHHLEHKSKNKRVSFPHQYQSALEISDRAVPVQESLCIQTLSCLQGLTSSQQPGLHLVSHMYFSSLSAKPYYMPYYRNKQTNKKKSKNLKLNPQNQDSSFILR